MNTIKTHYLKLILLSTMALCFLSMPKQSSLGQEILITQDLPSNAENIQETTDNLSVGTEIQTKISQFGEDLTNFKDKEINKLRRTNRGFSISFVVLGATATIITTVFGSVEPKSEKVIKQARVLAAVFGATAVFFQTLNTAFPVKTRAGEYALIQAELTILEFKLKDVSNESQLASLKDEFYALIRRAGEAEASEVEAAGTGTGTGEAEAVEAAGTSEAELPGAGEVEAAGTSEAEAEAVGD